MKKIFTLAFAAIVACAAHAQYYQLDNNLVFYTTNDTLMSDAGEAISYSTANLVNSFNSLGLPFSGNDGESNVKYLIKNDYTDAETGFTLKQGWYRPLRLTTGTVSFTGKFTDSNTLSEVSVNGFRNIKKAILYMVPVGGNGNNGWRDAPGGVRFQARYVSVAADGTVTNETNQTYIETKCGKTYNDALATDVPTNFLNTYVNPNDLSQWSCDQPFKLTVDFTNNGSFMEDGSYEVPFESDSKRTEFAPVEVDGLTEYTINYLFTKQGACASTTGEHSTLESASGYDNCTGKFYQKVAWTPETIVALSLKRNAWIVGIAFISANADAKNQYCDLTYGVGAQLSDDPNQAYGPESFDGVIPGWAKGEADGIQNIASEAVAAPRKTIEGNQIVIGNYNIAGQRVK